MPSKGTQPVFNQRLLKIPNLPLFDMPSKSSLLLKHMERPHVLRYLEILNKHCKIYVNTLDLKKKTGTLENIHYS